jgi:hypothetical protein
MGPLDALWHLLNLFAVPALLGLLAASAAKLLWRRELSGCRWRPLATWAVAAAAAAALAGLLVFGRDGRMATYAAMVSATAVSLWWRGFGPGRR